MSNEIIAGISQEEIKETVEEKLRAEGFDPQFPPTREALLDSIRELEPDVLILSSNFTEEDCGELVERLDAEIEELAIIPILEKSDTDRIRTMIENGAFDFLIRPVNWDLLLPRVESALQEIQGKRMDRIYSMALEERVNQRTEELWNKVRSIREQFVNTVHALCQALYAKHPYTEGHSWRVAKASERIGRAMGLSGKKLQNIRLGALFHDIGKIGVRDRLLDKPGELTDEEYESIKDHTVIASEILSPMKEFSDVVDIIKYEHENFDGTGYPFQKSGEDIPLGARIVRVADTYDAIVTTRSYRDGEDHKSALEEIRRVSGTQCCPTVVKYFLSLFPEEEGGLSEEERKDLLGDRYEEITNNDRGRINSREDLFEDLRETNEDGVVVIGE